MFAQFRHANDKNNDNDTNWRRRGGSNLISFTLKLANCRFLYYNFRTFLQGYVIVFFGKNMEDAKDPVF